MSDDMDLIPDYPDLVEHIFEFRIPRGQKPERLDSFLTRSIQNGTRNKVQAAIAEGLVKINGLPTKSSRKIQPGDHVVCTILKPPPIELIPQNIPLDIVYEDDYLMVVNKPAGMCVHPGLGNRSGTLVNAVLYYHGKREAIKVELDDEEGDESEGEVFAGDEVRPGVVHRIDKDTSGLLVMAKDPVAHTGLGRQFAAHTIEREYNAIVWGKYAEDEGRIEGDIGRSPFDRKKFAILKRGGKHAITDFWVLERFSIATLLKLKLHTGRTHQIRVHCSTNKHPLLGDETYGGKVLYYGAGMPETKKLGMKLLGMATRQMLHARTLGFVHPITNEFLRFDSPLPPDMEEVIAAMREFDAEKYR